MRTILILFIFFLFTTKGFSQWTQKEDFAGSSNRDMAVGFSIGNKGFIGTGSEIYSFGMPVSCVEDYKDFWEYNPENNTWIKKADFGGEARIQAVGFSIGDKGYIGTGGRSGYKTDFWEYNSGINSNSKLIENTFKIYPNPANNKITLKSPEKSIIELTDIKGQIIETFYQNNSNMTIDISSYPSGIYFVKVKTKEKMFVQKILKTEN